jgi:Dyp-type peroxidase family
MDQGPVTQSPPKQRNWKLAAPHDGWTQGIVVSGFGSLPVGRALFLEFSWPGVHVTKGAWITALQAIAPITDADGEDVRCASIGFTWEGLRKMGLNDNTLASFDRPFKEGMLQVDRLRRLGDRREDKWLPTVIEDGPKWSGNTPLDDAAAKEAARAFGTVEKSPPPRIETPITVHALLMLYDSDETALEKWCQSVIAGIAPHGVVVPHQLSLSLRPDAQSGIAREHFGFADGISQPLPYQSGVVKFSDGTDVPEDKWNGVPLGEILMGHLNGHNEIAPGPVVPDDDEGLGRKADLKPHKLGEGFLDFGLNGSYMVARELKQDVVQFWESMVEGAEQINAAAQADGKQVDADWIASRVIGRDRSGNLLCPGGVLPLGQTGGPDNHFGFFDTDRDGIGCPLGSHVRRGNPRDGLAPSEADKPTLLSAANRHRILRRGRKFGPDMADPKTDYGADRGLLFICLNTDITRQFEFVQQTWMLNPNFASLFDETDPLIGPSSTFTIPDEPLRRIIPVKTFVQMAGGEYFFLPSMPALRYLETL